MMQNYFGMAIPQNKDALYAMKKSVLAVLWHSTLFFQEYTDPPIPDEKEQHKFCPPLIDTWCNWQRDQLTGETTYKSKIDLCLEIHKLLVPIFRDLCSDGLLSKCLEGTTQNSKRHLIKLCGRNVQRQILLVEMFWK